MWSPREDLYHRLRRFHNRCARTMCRITIAHTIRHRIVRARAAGKNETEASHARAKAEADIALIFSCGATVVMFDILRNISLLTTLLLSKYI